MDHTEAARSSSAMLGTPKAKRRANFKPTRTSTLAPVASPPALTLIQALPEVVAAAALLEALPDAEELPDALPGAVPTADATDSINGLSPSLPPPSFSLF